MKTVVTDFRLRRWSSLFAVFGVCMGVCVLRQNKGKNMKKADERDAGAKVCGDGGCHSLVTNKCVTNNNLLFMLGKYKRKYNDPVKRVSPEVSSEQMTRTNVTANFFLLLVCLFHCFIFSLVENLLHVSSKRRKKRMQCLLIIIFKLVVWCCWSWQIFYCVLFSCAFHKCESLDFEHDFIIYGFSDHELMPLEITCSYVFAHTLSFFVLSMMNNITAAPQSSFFYLAWHVIYKQYPFHFGMPVIWYMKSICIRIDTRIGIRFPWKSNYLSTLKSNQILSSPSLSLSLFRLWHSYPSLPPIAAMGTIHKKPYQQLLGVWPTFPPYIRYTYLVELRCEPMQWNSFHRIYDIKYERIDWSILHVFGHTDTSSYQWWSRMMWYF